MVFTRRRGDAEGGRIKPKAGPTRTGHDREGGAKGERRGLRGDAGARRGFLGEGGAEEGAEDEADSGDGQDGHGAEINFGFGQVHFGEAQDAGDHYERGGCQAESVDGATDGFVAEDWTG